MEMKKLDEQISLDMLKNIDIKVESNEYNIEESS
jgi:hypothetical protein